MSDKKHANRVFYAILMLPKNPNPTTRRIITHMELLIVRLLVFRPLLSTHYSNNHLGPTKKFLEVHKEELANDWKFPSSEKLKWKKISYRNYRKTCINVLSGALFKKSELMYFMYQLLLGDSARSYCIRLVRWRNWATFRSKKLSQLFSPRGTTNLSTVCARVLREFTNLKKTIKKIWRFLYHTLESKFDQLIIVQLSHC